MEPSQTTVRDLESTQQLLAQAQAGDGEALERLITRYQVPLQRFAHGRLQAWARDGVDTADVVQDAMMQTIRRLPNIEAQGGGSFHAYLRTAVLNRLKDHQKRVGRHPPRVELPSKKASDIASPAEQAIGREALARYEAALQTLSKIEREAVVARVELNLSYREVAEAIGKPSSDAARMAVARALSKLARAMAAEAKGQLAD